MKNTVNYKLIQPVLTIIVLMIFNSVKSQEIKSSSGPGYYKFTTQNPDSVIIPFTILNGKPLLQVEINDEKATLLIDNGILWDQVWLFGSPLVTKLDMKPLKQESIGGAGEGDELAAYSSDNIKLKFNDIIFYEQPVLVSPPAAGFAKMFPGADGQLCNTFFKHFMVEFDFIKNLIILHDPGKFKYSGNGSIIDIKENTSGTYSLPFTFEMNDGKIYNDRMDIDFGGIYAIKIALNNKHNINLPDDVTETFSYGAQGKITEYSGKIKSMTFGRYTFENPVAVFGDEKTSSIHHDNLGVIGLPLFMKFNIIFDYINNKIYIDPNENFNEPFE